MRQPVRPEPRYTAARYQPALSVVDPSRGTSTATLAIAALLGLVAFVLRAVNIERTYDLFFDEAVYYRISDNVANSLSVTYDHAVPFFLHPPLFFLIEAAYLHLFPVHGDYASQILEVRYLNAVFGAVSAGVLFLVGRRLAGPIAGLAAAAIFSIEPFVLRIDSRNLLEASAGLWLLLGMLAVAGMIGSRSRTGRAVVAGLAFGLALLTNEPTAFLSLLPLAGCAVLGWAIPRRSALIAGATALGLYSFYPLISFASGNGGQFVTQKLRGVLRFSGRLQLSGFNAHQGPTFGQSIAVHWNDFATTYALIAAGAVATVYLLTRRDARSRLTALFAGSSYLLQAYSVKFGTNEEQYFYYLVLMAILAVAVASAARLESLAFRPSLHKRFGRRARAALTLVLAWAAAVWVGQHLITADDSYRRAMTYLQANVPRSARVAGTNSTDEALLVGEGYHVSQASTPASLQKNRVQYVLISSTLTQERYGTATPQLYAWLAQNAKPVAVFAGPSDGRLYIYRVPGQ